MSWCYTVAPHVTVNVETKEPYYVQHIEYISNKYLIIGMYNTMTNNLL